MSKDLQGINLADLLAELEEQEQQTYYPDPGEEYLSSKEWAMVWGVSLWRATRSIGLFVKAPRPMMEVGERVASDRCGRPYRQPVYKLCDWAMEAVQKAMGGDE